MKKITRYLSFLICLLMLCTSINGTDGSLITSLSATKTAQAASISSSTTSNQFIGWKGKGLRRKYYKNGKLQTGFRKIGNDYYLFDSKGRIKTGWQYAGKHYRLFHKKTGKMVRSRTYQGRKIDRNGIWTPIVVLDAGHSANVARGYEPLGPGSSEQKAKDNSGTDGVATGVPEYVLTLNMAKKLQTTLKKQGCKVILTRKNNRTALSCAQRARIANKAKADAYLRIHANGVDSSSVTGAMTICVTRGNRFVSSSMYKKSYNLSKAVLNAYVKATGCRKDYIWETDTMRGNNCSKVPTTLIELGYMSNPAEDRLMQSTSYQKKMVKGMANGIKKYLLGQ